MGRRDYGACSLPINSTENMNGVAVFQKAITY